MALDESAFETVADATLHGLFETLEERLGDALDADLQGGILTVALESGGQYVINKHAPNRQIWMSSPKSGASHYVYDPAARRWVGTRDGRDLKTVLADELKAATGAAVSFS